MSKPKKAFLSKLDMMWGIHWRLSKAREFPGIDRKLRSLREEGKLTPVEWQNRRDARLRHLLTLAQTHVPHYRDTFESVGFNPGSSDALQRFRHLPILTKDFIRDNLDNLIARTVNRTRIYENATGGSTGVPLKFYQDQEYKTTALAIDTYAREWWGIRPYDLTALAWGADREFYELSLKERLYEWRQRTLSLNAFRMNDENILEFCRTLAYRKPKHLMGYSSALEALAKSAQNNGINNLSFKAIRSTAETLWPHQRKLIEDHLNGPVYNFYGSREINNIAAECPEARRLHLISTWRYVEIVDQNGHPVPNGETGYIVITDLSNYAMPFIRYRNEDMGRMSVETCPCGRPTPVIEELLGRRTDLIRTPQGDIIHGEFFTHLFYGRNDIKQFQVHQTSLDHLVLRYVPINHVPSEFIENVLGKIRERVGQEVAVGIEVCKEIPIPDSGKHRFTISDVHD